MAEATAGKRYRVIGKHIFRASTIDVNMGGTKADGTPNIVRQMGPIEQVAVGTILDDVTEKELAAAPDRFALVDEEAEAKTQQAMAEAGAPPMAFADERGVHEPAAHPNAPIQKPPLTGAEVAVVKDAMQSVQQVEVKHAEQAAQMDKELQEAQDKALAEASQKQAQQARERGPGGRFQASPPPPPPPAAASPPPATSGGDAATEHGRRRP